MGAGDHGLFRIVTEPGCDLAGLAAALLVKSPIPLGERLAKFLGLEFGDLRLPDVGLNLVFNGSALVVELPMLKLKLAGLDLEQVSLLPR